MLSSLSTPPLLGETPVPSSCILRPSLGGPSVPQPHTGQDDPFPDLLWQFISLPLASVSPKQQSHESLSGSHEALTGQFRVERAEPNGQPLGVSPPILPPVLEGDWALSVFINPSEGAF